MLEESLGKRWIIKRDAKEMDGTREGIAVGKMKNVRTFFFAVFRNLLLRVFFRGQVTKEQNNGISEAKNQSTTQGGDIMFPELLICQVFNINKSKSCCLYIITYCRDSKQISCPCLYPSFWSWGQCQLALPKGGKGLHLVYTRASNPWMGKMNAKYHAD